jgi:HD-like signal output (HDOD) protein
MMLNNNDALQRLNFKHIPVLPPGAPHLLKSLTDDSISFIELAGIIERYPTIAARLISLANSAWSSPVSEITSLENACSRLGFDVVRSASIALAVSAPFDTSRCPGFKSRFFWCSGLLAADAAAWLAQCSKATQIEPATARAAGLIHNLGLLLMADQLPKDVDQAIRLIQKEEGMQLSQALLYILGFDHCDAGRQLGIAWELPDLMVNAMDYRIDNDEQEQVDEVTCLIDVTVSMLRALQRNGPWAIPQIQLDWLQITPADASMVFDRLSGQLAQIEELANTLFSV